VGANKCEFYAPDLGITLCKTFTAKLKGLETTGIQRFLVIHSLLGIKTRDSIVGYVENRGKAHKQALWGMLKNVRETQTRVNIMHIGLFGR